MDIVLMPDKFKGSLTAEEVRTAVQSGIREQFPNTRFRNFAVSDGGDGFLEAVKAVRRVSECEVSVQDPLGRPVKASFLLDDETSEAFIEMAVASGMVLLDEAERNPLLTSTLGTGQLLKYAIKQSAKTLYVGLGGSATNDGGIGLAAAFGFTFLDKNGRELEAVGGKLNAIKSIVPPKGPVLPEGIRIIAVNDVNNPLWGPDGAAKVYAAQKGATAAMVDQLDAGLQHLDSLVIKQLGKEAGSLPGAGAAGGTAYGLHAFLNASFISGTDYIFKLNGVSDYLKQNTPDFIITGEGKIDEQTLKGKVIEGVLQLGSEHGIPVLAVCGICTADRGLLASAGLTDVIEIAHPDKDLAYNMEHAAKLTKEAVSRWFEKMK
ncbi:glycerate kinase [Robiginitalea sp. IMCC44478]|uniref:glycerate kinase n=1 Tax=Robiginitalea sp. IMCC44478 TaxID=3459122 RepID=UPI0040427A73